jgi:DNA-binding MarR family transcriptional regulator
MDASDLDLPTLVSLAGPAIERLLLVRIADAGHTGVKPSHGYVIQRLIDHAPTIGELATSLGMTQQGASKQVVDLERLGYAERVADRLDQRIRRVRLTEAGRAMLASGRQARADLEAEVTGAVGPAEVQTAKRVLAAMLQLTGLDQHIATRSVPLPS